MRRMTNVGRAFAVALATLGAAVISGACSSGTPGTGGGGSSSVACGNGKCEAGETCQTCPGDCGSCPVLCGNGMCEAGETCSSCPGDCGQCCGNGTCEADFGETCSTCSQDCGDCCGNGKCESQLGENCDTCAQDCGNCCGNGKCEAKYGEHCSSCSKDCGQCCGNGKCDSSYGESCNTCPDDCAGCCGDGYCSPFEDWQDCWADCSTGAPNMQISLGKCSAFFISDAGGPDYLWVNGNTMELMYNADDSTNPVRLLPYPNTPYIYSGNTSGGTASFLINGSPVNLGVSCALSSTNTCNVWLSSLNKYQDVTLNGTGYSISDYSTLSQCP